MKVLSTIWWLKTRVWSPIWAPTREPEPEPESELQFKGEQLQHELSGRTAGRTITLLDASNEGRKLLSGGWRMHCSLIGLENPGSNKLTRAAASLQPDNWSNTHRSYRVCVRFKVNFSVCWWFLSSWTINSEVIQAGETISKYRLSEYDQTNQHFRRNRRRKSPNQEGSLCRLAQSDCSWRNASSIVEELILALDM